MSVKAGARGVLAATDDTCLVVLPLFQWCAGTWQEMVTTEPEQLDLIDSACQSTNHSMESKDLSPGRRGRIVSRDISGEGSRKCS